jgi:hypothetical protein
MEILNYSKVSVDINPVHMVISKNNYKMYRENDKGFLIKLL